MGAGLVRLGFRDYDPDAGRSTGKDPILFGAGDTDLYGYCLYDPINRTDKNGLMALYHAYDATKTVKLRREIDKLEDQAWQNQDAETALIMDSIKRELEKEGFDKLRKALEAAPADTTFGGIPPTSKPEVLIEILEELLKLMEEIENEGNCKP